MTKLRECNSCKICTLKENCPKCKQKTSDAHYKFVRIKSFESNEKIK